MSQLSVVFCVEKPIGRACLEFALSHPGVKVAAVVARDAADAWWGSDNFAELCNQHRIPHVSRVDLAKISYDFLISVGYPFKLDVSLLNRASRGCINLHLGPLPRWRGCNTVAHAILERDVQYGVTLHQMEETLDSGPIYVREEFGISADVTGRELFEFSEMAGRQLFQRWFPRILAGDVTKFPQVEAESRGTHQRDSIEPFKVIPLESSMDEVYLRARALEFVPWDPPSFSLRGQKYFALIGDGVGRSKTTLQKFKRCQSVKELGMLDLNLAEPRVIEEFRRPLVLIGEAKYRELNGLIA